LLRLSPVDTLAAVPSWVRYLPITFFVSYLTFTVLLFAFGPWPYPVTDGTKLYAFLIAAHLALVMGYRSAIKSKAHGYSGRWSIRGLLTVSLIVGLPVLLASVRFRVSISASDLLGGSASLADAYRLSNTLRTETTPIIEYVRFFVGPWLALIFPLTIYYWSLLSRPLRFASVVYILGNIGMFVLTGTNKLIADTVILFPWLVLAGTVSGHIRIRRLGKFILGVSSILLFVVFTLFFTETQSSRTGTIAVDSAYFPGAGVWADNDNFMVSQLSGSAKRGVLSGVSYLSQGYYALYLALDKPFVPTFGVGNSTFLARQAVRLTGDANFLLDPYPVRLEDDGWDAYGLWSTIYPWIASDVSFPLTIFVVFLVGRMLALCWLDTLQGSNPFAVAMFIQFAIMLYYFNANNQCLQSGEGFSGFVILLFLWLTTRRKPAVGLRRLAI
jgi:hypothetical protein